MIIYKDKSCSAGTEDAVPLESRCPENPLPVVDIDAFRSGAFPRDTASSFALARLEEHPSIIAVDASLHTAKRLFGRMSAFVEQECKARIPSVYERAAGHDLRLEDIAAYFTRCREEGISINSEENRFRAELLDAGLIRYENGTDVPLEDAAVIAVGSDLPVFEYEETVLHEYAHGLYFTDARYRAQVDARWDALPSSAQRFLEGAIIASGYYRCGAGWLVRTETDAHARESLGSLANFILDASEHCSSAQKSDACEAFFSYEGNIAMLLDRVHEHFSTEPLPGVKTAPPSDATADADAALPLKMLHIKLSTMPPLKLPTVDDMLEFLPEEERRNIPVSSPPRDLDEELNKLQDRFDLAHGRTTCEADD